MTERKNNQGESKSTNPRDDGMLDNSEMEKVVGGMTIDEVDFSDGLSEEEQQTIETWAKTAGRDGLG